MFEAATLVIDEPLMDTLPPIITVSLEPPMLMAVAPLPVPMFTVWVCDDVPMLTWSALPVPRLTIGESMAAFNVPVTVMVPDVSSEQVM